MEIIKTTFGVMAAFLFIVAMLWTPAILCVAAGYGKGVCGL